MGRVFFLINLLLLRGAESFLKHLQSRRKTIHNFSGADVVELAKIVLDGTGYEGASTGYSKCNEGASAVCREITCGCPSGCDVRYEGARVMNSMA
jgi:hypothetical protein